MDEGKEKQTNAAGSQTKHTPMADMDQKRAEETKEKGGVHTNAQGE